MKSTTFDGTQPCAQSDPEAWFPEGGAYTSDNMLAKRLCQTCRFKTPCLNVALAIIPAPVGIWGGMTEVERQSLKRRIARRNVA